MCHQALCVLWTAPALPYPYQADVIEASKTGVHPAFRARFAAFCVLRVRFRGSGQREPGRVSDCLTAQCVSRQLM